MTVIVGVKHEGNVWMGGDSCSGWHNSAIRARGAQPKVFVLNVPFDDVGDTQTRLGFKLAIGYTGSARMGQLLQYHLPIPAPAHADPVAYLACEIVPNVRKVLKDGGWAKREDEREEGGLFMVGYRGHLVTIESDYQVHEVDEDYWAIGSGWELALGALAMLEEIAPNVSPMQKIEIAMHAAAKHDPWVMEPFLVFSV